VVDVEGHGSGHRQAQKARCCLIRNMLEAVQESNFSVPVILCQVYDPITEKRGDGGVFGTILRRPVALQNRSPAWMCSHHAAS
jgi:hypothetical protein